VTTFPLLDAAGLRYTVRTTSRGVPYAGLSWASRDPDSPLALTVLDADGVLRITAHDVARDTAGGLARLLVTTTRLPRGRLLRRPDATASDLAVTMWGARRRATGDLWTALAYLEDVRDWLAGVAPPPPAPSPLERVTELEVDGVPVRVGTAAGGAAVAVAEVPVPPLRIDAATAAWVDRLQWWAPTGRFLLGPGDTLRAEASSEPLLDAGEPAGLRVQVAAAAAALAAEAVRTAAPSR
jgi:hypothetical protein